ncbi:hypothetical protein RclHR1_00140013 [Rhizophagus clarus]|uniref:Kinase-like domain-containing protein n=1 Tax=Rhizophagus clarus TaxID=94130 RepID=A0A2Z6QNX0_9GLOM|nr:hypothetical protein RclHR1_00140013 [Rhizophagus clarus]GES77250.1 kinase-like domain-containing protein [Rhizophagus clarus]
MDEIKLSDYVIEQIKDFPSSFQALTEEQTPLIDKLILNEELKKRYKWYGLCKECKQPNIDSGWCQPCIRNHLKQNFKSWTSGNNEVDKFIRETQLKAKNRHQILEWIEYDKFEDIKYLAKGGFGTTYKAIWKDDPFWEKNYGEWGKIGETKVALKCLHNSQDISAEFFKELESNIIASKSGNGFVVRCFGITKDPKTNNFMIVMDLKKCSLRQHLNDNFNSLSWNKKIIMLRGISIGLRDIQNSGLIHRDFHCGNLLNNIYDSEVYITDLGLCQPANVKQGDNKKIYGVLPYMAPEVLRGKEYTQASDIYGFGIIAYEICTGLPPYHDIAHDELLAIKICQGLRPKSNYKIPQLILDIINQCWDADPLKRPKANGLSRLIKELYFDYNDEGSILYKQIEEADEINDKPSSIVQSSSLFTSTLSYTTHPQAVYTSRLLDFKNLPEPKNAVEYSESLRMDFTKLDLNSKGERN